MQISLPTVDPFHRYQNYVQDIVSIHWIVHVLKLTFHLINLTFALAAGKDFR